MGNNPTEATYSSPSTSKIPEPTTTTRPAPSVVSPDEGHGPVIAEIAIGISSVVVAIIGIIVNVRYRTEIRLIFTGHHTVVLI